MASTAIVVGIDIAKADFVGACRPDGTSWTATVIRKASPPPWIGCAA
jgi:hypothetical protein